MNLKRKTYIALVIFGAFILIFVLLVIYPLLQGLKKNSEQFLTQKKDLILLNNKIKNLKNFKKIYQTHQQKLEKINRLFINPELPTDLINFVGFLRKIAKNSQVSISISPPSLKQKITNDPWSSVTFQISATGKFSNFSKFLERLETASYLIEIPNLTLKKLTEKDLKSKQFQAFSPGDVHANLSLKIFVK